VLDSTGFHRSNPNLSSCEISACKGCPLCQSSTFLHLLEVFRRTDRALRHLLHAQDAQLAALRESCAHFKQVNQSSVQRCFRCGLRFDTAHQAVETAHTTETQIACNSPGKEETVYPILETSDFTSAPSNGKRRRDDSDDLPEPEQLDGSSASLDFFSVEGDAGIGWDQI
jgi:hypothetical protein